MNFNKVVQKNKFLILAVFMAAITWLLSIAKITTTENHFQPFNANLIEKQQVLDHWIDSVEISLERGKLAYFVNSNKDQLDGLYKKYGISIHVFSKNHEVYWTNNAVIIPEITDSIKNSFTEVGNAAIEIRSKTSANYKIIGSILIKMRYPYENKFLQNKFHPSFNIGNDVSILKGNKNDSGAIISNDGEYLFTLKQEDSKNSSRLNSIILFSLFACILLLLLYGRDLFFFTKFTHGYFVAFASLMIIARFFVQLVLKPSIIYSLPLFNPVHFASNIIFPSLGDLLITVGLISYLIFVYYSKIKIRDQKQTSILKRIIVSVIWLILIHFYCFVCLYIFKHLIDDSAFQFEAYNILQLSSYSFVGYLAIIFSFIGLVLLVDKAAQHLKQFISFNRLSIIIVLVAIVVTTGWLMLGNGFDTLSYIWFVAICLYWIYIRYNHKIKFTTLFILVAFLSAFSSNYIHRKSFDKRNEESKVIAINLAREQDPVAEVVISEILADMKSDSIITQKLNPNGFIYDDFYDYLKKQYFEGYLRQYNFQLTICSDSDSLLLSETEDDWQHCFTFFEALTNENGVETNIPNLYYMKNNLGLINYLFQVEIALNTTNKVRLFIELINKPNQEVLGYPELLLDDKSQNNNSRTIENYAKYAGNRLLSRVGEFPYAFERSVYENNTTEFSFFQSEGYDHLVYNYDNNGSVIISYPTVLFYNTLISFTYIFFFFLVIVLSFSLIGNRFTHIIDFQLSIKNKITFSMILILVLSMIFVATGTIFYTKSQFENTQRKILGEKIQSVLVELEHKLSNVERIEHIDEDYLNSLLIKFSNVFYTDINMYDLEGNLLATSRNEIFERQLTSNKMNSVAYRELVLNKKARIVHKENIGDLFYYSAYVPFISSDNKLLAYLNLPYFSKEIILRQELLKVIVAIVNIYAFLIILSILLAIYMSNKLTQPLRLVQQRISNINLSKKNERVNYSGKDEIAELVNEFNRMLEELDRSARLLAKSERESAWREMARQIAHEIKNPLTPMKLSIQLLEKSWLNKDEDFGERIKRVAQTNIEQIDSLSSIATAFSQFAQMPAIRSEKVNLVQKIQLSSELFDECSNVRLVVDTPDVKEVNVLADNERILQVFNNLIKNAIQAIPKHQVGEVHISINETEESVVVEIKDNGVGISSEMEDHLFQPNFTTKGSGTGLGLAIVKNIVEEFGGAIWFKSEEGKGSSFFVSMPLFKN